MIEIRVEDVGSLGEGEARKFPYVRAGGEVEEGFILLVRGILVAYRNQCRHWTVDLDMGEGTFWSKRLGRIYCKTHGALYEPMTGVCDGGPCIGERLEKFGVLRDGPDAIVQIPDQ